jgi:HEAT repeat protein
MAEITESTDAALTERILQWTSALDSAIRREREEARRALVATGPVAVPALVECTRSDTIHLRWEAAKALGEIADPAAAPALIALLDDEDGGVRWLAAEGLLALERTALGPLLDALERPASHRLREGAHHVLRRLPCWRLVELLKPVVEALEHTGAEVTVAVAAGSALESLRNEDLVAPRPSRN